MNVPGSYNPNITNSPIGTPLVNVNATAAVAADVDDGPSEDGPMKVSFPLRGHEVPFIIVERSKRKSDEKIYRLRPQIAPEGIIEFLEDVLVNAGNTKEQARAKIYATLYKEFLIEAAAEASEGVFTTKIDPATGEPIDDTDHQKYFSQLADLFEPASRRKSGETKAQLNTRCRLLSEQLTELLGLGAGGKPVFPTEGSPEYIQLSTITAELTEANAKLQAKEGTKAVARPRKPKAAKKVEVLAQS